MADYPMGALHFQVEWGGSRSAFSEASGLTIEYDVIEYREGNDREFGSRKMPGRPRYSNVVLKRGIMQGDNELFQWINTIRLHQVERRDVMISLLNAEHEPVLSWRIMNAFPVKLEGPTLSATGNEIAIETLELAHEGIRIDAAGAARAK